MSSQWRIKEGAFAVLAVTVGLAASIALAPKDTTFVPNALFFWLSQLAVLFTLVPIMPRGAAVAGVALALALYLAAFDAWLARESMAWLGYLFSLPGAVVGAVTIALWLRTRPELRPVMVACLAASAVLIGLFVNQILICNTVMYCGGK